MTPWRPIIVSWVYELCRSSCGLHEDRSRILRLGEESFGSAEALFYVGILAVESLLLIDSNG